eukprot:CFRG0945T1
MLITSMYSPTVQYLPDGQVAALAKKNIDSIAIERVWGSRESRLRKKSRAELVVVKQQLRRTNLTLVLNVVDEGKPTATTDNDVDEKIKRLGILRKQAEDDLQLKEAIHERYQSSVWGIKDTNDSKTRDITAVDSTLLIAEEVKGGIERTFEFTTCGNIAEQILSIAYGVALAVRFNRTVVLPVVESFQRQFSAEEESITNEVITTITVGVRKLLHQRIEFSDLFDEDEFVAGMMEYHVNIIRKLSSVVSDFSNVTHLTASSLNAQLLTENDTPRVRLNGCSLYAMSAADVSQYSAIFTATVRNLKPCLLLSKIITSGTNMLSKLSGNRVYNGVEILTEKSWGGPNSARKKCTRIVRESFDMALKPNSNEAQSLSYDKAIASLCDEPCPHVEEIVDLLKKRGTRRGRPLYLARSVDFTSDVLTALRESFRHVLTITDIVKYQDTIEFLSPEQQELIDFWICEASTVFIGHSVSTFTSLQALIRMPKNDYTYWYNSGTIPLAHRMPIFKGVPLVFAYDKEQNQEEQLKKSIESAIEVGITSLICIYTRPTLPRSIRTSLSQQESTTVTDPLVSWMQFRGIRVLQPDAEVLKSTENQWLGVNIPKLRIHHEYVIVSDLGWISAASTMFHELGWILPTKTGASRFHATVEPDNTETANALLYHMPRMTETVVELQHYIGTKLIDILLPERCRVGLELILSFYSKNGTSIYQ